MMHTYINIMADTAGFGVYCVQPQLHRGVAVMWRHLHNIMKNTTVFEGYNLKKKKGKICVSFFKYFVSDERVRQLYLRIYTAKNIGLSVSTINS